MRKTGIYLVAGCLVFLIMAHHSLAAVRPGSPEKTFTGKLIDMAATKGRYKLTIDGRIMFIVNDETPQNQLLIKTATSLKNKIITVTYKPGNIIMTIQLHKKKKHF